MSPITANDLKTRGVAAIEALLATQPEAMISVHGKERYVVMSVEHYHYMRECELDSALAQSQADVAAGRFVVESAQAHMARMEAMLAQGSDAVPQIMAAPLKPLAKKRAVKVPTRKAPRRKSAA